MMKYGTLCNPENDAILKRRNTENYVKIYSIIFNITTRKTYHEVKYTALSAMQ